MQKSSFRPMAHGAGVFGSRAWTPLLLQNPEYEMLLKERKEHPEQKDYHAQNKVNFRRSPFLDFLGTLLCKNISDSLQCLHYLTYNITSREQHESATPLKLKKSKNIPKRQRKVLFRKIINLTVPKGNLLGLKGFAAHFC